MSDAAREKAKAISEAAKSAQEHEEDRTDEEEKVLAGRHDANIPAMLTRDVPGG